jgi:tetratricopeptide (TPR) repeat protein
LPTFCASCGYSFSVPARFCPNCGVATGESGVATRVIPFDTTGLPPGATFGATMADGAGSTIGPGSTIGATLDPGATIVSGAGFDAGATLVSGAGFDAGATLGPGAAFDPGATIGVGATIGATIGAGAPIDGALAGGPLRVGQSFSPRYHIIKVLGVGGMGAVYQAWDAELGVAVALKVIRTDTTRRSASSEAEKRFKQELLLARQVTHKNVVRIHDLGEIDGIKYITMPFVQGHDLATVLQKAGKLPIARALPIARQIAGGMGAAHEAGVVHRDLKPANIMIAADDLALIMDFGISASNEEANSGGITGTLEYMAPEQSTGAALDGRADIYAFGLIVYEMLSGLRKSTATTGQERVDAMRARTKEGVPPLRSLDETIPIPLDALVMRCLERDPAARFATTAELTAELDRLDERGELIPVKKVVGVRLFASVVVVALALLGGTWYVASRPAPPQRAPLPVLIANFDNRTGDPLFDRTLEQNVSLGMEQASFITAYPRRDALRVAAEMKAGSSLDESVARLIATREGIKVVLSGSIEQKGTKYNVNVKAQQPDGQIISNLTATASSKSDVLGVVGTLTARMRRALGDTAPPKPGEMEALTTASLEAAHAYALAQESQASDKLTDAIRYYQQAVDLDPNLGRAYAGLAVANFNLKKRAEAGEYYKKALALVGRMSEREKGRTLGTYYLSFEGNYELAIDTLRKHVALYPADAAAHTNLGAAYVRVGDMANAAASSRRAIEITPKNLKRRYNYALHSMYAGDLTTAVAEAQKVLEQDPGYQFAYVTLALSALLGGDPNKAAEMYRKLETLDAEGASVGKMGLADLDMYAGRYRDAVGILQDGITADEKENNSGELAFKLVAIAEAYNVLGRKADAVSAANKALKASTLEGIQFLAARVLIEAGGEARAEEIATELDNRLQKQTHSLSLMLKGDIALKRKRIAEAFDAYREAQKAHDSWISHFLMGKAYVEAGGHFPEALTQLEAAEKRAGEATDLFDSDTTTLRYLPTLYYWLGRAQEGLGSSDAARKSYQKFIAIREHSDPVDKLLADAKRGAGQ